MCLFFRIQDGLCRGRIAFLLSFVVLIILHYNNDGIRLLTRTVWIRQAFEVFGLFELLCIHIHIYVLYVYNPHDIRRYSRNLMT